MRLPTVAAALAALAALVARASAASGPAISCCLDVSGTVVPPRRVTDFRLQSAALCPVRAMLLVTTSGKTVCADPEKKWVKRAIRWVKSKRGETRGRPQTTRRRKSDRGKPRNKGKQRIGQRRHNKD